MKAKKQKLNVRLLRHIQKHITEEPRRFFMDQIVATGEPNSRHWGTFALDLADSVPPCGTAACIAGWTAILSGKTPKQAINLSLDWSCRKLGLDPESFGESAPFVSPLFFDWKWPEPFSTRYAMAKTPKARAKIACQRIDHLIKTGE